MAIPMAAALGMSAIGAAGSIVGGGKAAKAQTAAANKATKAQMKMFKMTREALAPFIEAGAAGAEALPGMAADPYFSEPIPFTTESLEATPGYQFMREQGLRATQRGYAAKGLGSSGAAMKGAARFATGLAENTYRTIFDLEQAQRNNIWGRFSNLATMGSSAAAGLASNATQVGSNIGSNIIGAGNAAAGAYMNAGSNVANVANNLAGFAYMKPYLDSRYG